LNVSYPGPPGRLPAIVPTCRDGGGSAAYRLRRRLAARPKAPRPSIAIVAGSGT